MARRLRGARLAHGDLQHGNVILMPATRKYGKLAIKLIDYDGMYVPALAGRRSGEVGHPAYQHPQRLREATYGPEVDRFPLLVIYVAIRALMAGGRALWERYDNGYNLLFREEDLRSPRASRLFWELVRQNDPEVRRLADCLSRAARRPLEETPLLGSLVESPAAPLARGPELPGAPMPRPYPVAVPVMEHATASLQVAGARKTGIKSRTLVAALTGVAGLLGVCCLSLAPFVFVGSDENPGTSSRVAKGKAIPVTTEKTTLPTRREPWPEVGSTPTPTPRSTPKLTTPPVKGEPEGPSTAPPAEHQPRSTDGPVWEVKKYVGGGTLVNPGGPIAFSADGRRCVWAYGKAMFNGSYGSFDIFLLDLEKSRQIHRFQGHTDRVMALAFSPDGRRVLSGGSDHTLRLWDTEKGTLVGRLDGHRATVVGISFSSNGSRAVSISNREWGDEAASDNTMRLWDIASQRELHRFGGYRGAVHSVSFVSGSSVVLTGHHTPPKSTIYSWDADTGKKLREYEFATQGSPLTTVFSTDGRYAAISDGYGYLYIFGIPDRTRVCAFRSPGEGRHFYGMTFSGDGRRILSPSEEAVYAWNVKNGQVLATLKSFGGTAAISPDGRRAVCSGYSLSLWRLPGAADE
jgi:WD40 repeat protein